MAKEFRLPVMYTIAILYQFNSQVLFQPICNFFSETELFNRCAKMVCQRFASNYCNVIVKWIGVDKHVIVIYPNLFVEFYPLIHTPNNSKSLYK